jgi:hypothetical protein
MLIAVLLTEQLKAERLERQRDDPFYLTDQRSPTRGAAQEDVDSIPVVRLDGLPSLSQTSLGGSASGFVFHTQGC